MTRALLSRLSTTINSGQPLWAILWANEYQQELGALHKALVKVARSKISELEYLEVATTDAQETISKVLSGVKLSALEPRCRQNIAELERAIQPRAQKVVSMAGRRTKRYQVGLPDQRIHARPRDIRRTINW